MLERHPERVHSVVLAERREDPRVRAIDELAQRHHRPVERVDAQTLKRLLGDVAHQGVAADITPLPPWSEKELIGALERAKGPLLLALDGVQDPHNLGAIIRTAEAAGADGVVIPERRAVGVTGTVAKASAGASEHLPIARVTNIARTLEELKNASVWTVGLDERAPQTYDLLDYNMDCAIVLGAEGEGLHDLVRKRCDFLVSLPMVGRVPSLNVSVAAGIVLYEVVRQRNSGSPQRRGEIG
jgi:23S rRNA (guanosine2251-2'-O)-methyltransferase